MIVGILSDTHGRADTAAVAVRLLREQKAEYLIHCGDVCGETVLDALAGVPSAFVYGNNDYDRVDLARYAHALGIQCLGDGGTLDLGGKRIAVTHGDNSRTVTQLASKMTGAHYLLTGHTHQRHDRRVGSVRWINPGALYRALVRSVAVLDVSTDTLTFLNVPDD
ncbi:MAG TPA: YfcE family phosphodiesterase [Tepidisphaeraceae bacterium]|jgi:hypothetical protein